MRLDEIRLGSRTLQPRRQLLVNGRREPIGKRALDILSVLAEARGQIVTKEELLEQVWPGVIVEENALQVHVVALRKALGPEADRLKTIRGVGYQLDVDGEVSPADRTKTDANDTVPPFLQARSTQPSGQVPQSWLTSLKRTVAAHRWAAIAALALAMLAAGWSLFGSSLGLAPQERIPVVVRALTANAGASPTDSALASGITDELILRLRRLPDLRIATAGPDGNAPSEAFADGHVVDGHIRSVGQRVRVTARLSGPDGEVIWTETFDRTLADLFDVQEEIASKIAGALSVSFDVGVDSSQFGGTDNPDAYAAYVQFRANQTNPDQSIPLGFLERALELDPDYGKALNSLSISYGIRASAATSTAEALALLAEMDRRTERAVAENPDLAIAHLARAYYHLQRRNLIETERSFARVAELNKGNDPELILNIAAHQMNMGRLKRMEALKDTVRAIDPVHAQGLSIVWNELYLSRYQSVLDIFDRYGSEAGPAVSRVDFWALLSLGREEEAVAIAVERAPYMADNLRIYRQEPRLSRMSGSELRRWAAGHFGDGGHHHLGHLAVLAGIDEQPRLAVELLRIAFERPGGYGLRLVWHPALAEARKLPEFRALVKELGYVEAWRESGDWGDFCRPVSAREITCI